jgi:hypothetical protein
MGTMPGPSAGSSAADDFEEDRRILFVAALVG